MVLRADRYRIPRSSEGGLASLDVILVGGGGSHLRVVGLSSKTHYAIVGAEPNLPKDQFDIFKDYYFTPILEIRGGALGTWLRQLERVRPMVAIEVRNLDEFDAFVDVFRRAAAGEGFVQIETD